MHREPVVTDKTNELKKVTIYTDGACTGNPGPGGYGVILSYGAKRKELSGGFLLTTNNRMELTAAIVALQELRYPCAVTLYTDSQYVVNGINKGWAAKWKANGWMRTPTARAVNHDLWEELLELCEKHQVTFSWVRGHAGHAENERCDRLAVAETRRLDLPIDTGYEPGQ